MKRNNFCAYLDAGHGGVNQYGHYMTAPSKQHNHGEPHCFHNGGWFYEGVFNRQIVDRVAHKLSGLGINYMKVYDEVFDTSLGDRVSRANWYHKNGHPGLFVSSHANASSSHRARGMEVFTSRGKTVSDLVAQDYYDNTKSLLGDLIGYRQDTSDGDDDKEGNFYVLVNTEMPAILIEHLFFDNLEDAKLLNDEVIQDLFAEAQVRTIVQFKNRF